MRLLLPSLTLFAAVSLGAAQTPAGYANGIGPVAKIEKPEFKGSVQFRVPNERGNQTGQISLPKGSTQGMDSHLFVGPRGGFVSVDIELVGDHAMSVSSGRRTAPAKTGEHLVSAGPWIGDYSERMLSDNIRMGRLYNVYSPKVVYTMMISWPAKDSVAKKDAEMLARFVVWSFKLNG